MISDAETWKELSKNIEAEQGASFQSLQFKRGESIYNVGEASKGLYFIEEGLVGLVLAGATGAEHLLRFFRGGQVFGHRALFAEDVYHGRAVALEPSRIKFISVDAVRAFLHTQPHHYLVFAQVLAKELRRSEVQHVMILENHVLPRVARAVVYLRDIHPEHRWTRQEIANFCASTVSTVIKALAELEKRGMIRQVGRAIEVRDRKALLMLEEESSLLT